MRHSLALAAIGGVVLATLHAATGPRRARLRNQALAAHKANIKAAKRA